MLRAESEGAARFPTQHDEGGGAQQRESLGAEGSGCRSATVGDCKSTPAGEGDWATSTDAAEAI